MVVDATRPRSGPGRARPGAIYRGAGRAGRRVLGRRWPRHGDDAGSPLAESITGSARARSRPRVGAIVFGADRGGLRCRAADRPAGPPVRRCCRASRIVGLVLSFLCWQVAGNTMPLGSTPRAAPCQRRAAADLRRAGRRAVRTQRRHQRGDRGPVPDRARSSARSSARSPTRPGSACSAPIARRAGSSPALLAVLAIRYLVDQVVLGVVLNLLALGLTSFLYTQVMQPNAARFNSRRRCRTGRSRCCRKIPIIGPALFEQNILLYLAIVAGRSAYTSACSTRGGACAPGRSASTRPRPTRSASRCCAVRYRNVLIAGVIAGVGGAFFTIGSDTSFSKNMTGRQGLHRAGRADLRPVDADRRHAGRAAVRLLRPARRATWARSARRSRSQFLAMLPYVVTILAVAGLSGGSERRPPTASRTLRAELAVRPSRDEWRLGEHGHRLGIAARGGDRRDAAARTRRTRGFRSAPPRWSTTAGSCAAATWRTRRTG